MSESSIEYQVFADINKMAAKVTGDITFRQMIEFLVVLGQSGDYKQGMNCIYDFSHCTSIGGDLSKLSKFGDAISDENHVTEYSKTSLLIPDNNPQLKKLVEGIVLMSSQSAVKHKIFDYSKKREAFAYIDISESDARFIEQYLNHKD